MIIFIIGRNLCIFCKPCLVGRQFFHLHLILQPVSGTIDACLISSSSNRLQKSLMDPCPLLSLKPVCSPCTAGALAVKKYRIVYIVFFDQADHHTGLFHGFHFIHRLGEEIHSYRNLRLNRTPDVLLIHRV